MKKSWSEIQERFWRGSLSEKELEELLRNHPELKAQAEDLRLTQLLKELPGVPVPSNFTSRVLARIEEEAVRERRAAVAEPPRASFWTFWLPRAGLASALVALGLLGVQKYQERREAAWARDMVIFSHIVEMPLIERVNPLPVADEQELIFALQ